jgi:c-di-GMP-binding flagellar brake protein YcgR
MSEPIALGPAEVVTITSPRGYRAALRRPCHSDFLVRLVIRPSFRNLRAYVHDISPTGIGLLFNRPLKKGSLVALQLRQERHKMCPILTAHVAHSRPQGEEWWLVGCEFSEPLAEIELERLLEE